MEKQNVLSAEELVIRYGTDTKYMVVDLFEIIKNINMVQTEISELKGRLELSRSQMKMNEPECSTVPCHTSDRTNEGGIKLPVTVMDSIDNQTVQEWEFPSCSRVASRNF